MKRIVPFIGFFAVAGCGGGGSNNPPPAPGPDMAMCTPGQPLGDPNAAMRDSCSYAAGALATDTLGLTDAQRQAIPIKHIIVLMKENRSYDMILGQLAMAGQPDSEPVPAGFANPDPNGVAVPRFHQTNSCVQNDPPHQWAEMHSQVDSGKMDGFVANGTQSDPVSDGHFVMGYYDQTDLPFYYWLASTFAVADHDFASVRSGTWANRDFLVAATSNGTKDTETDPQLSGVPLIFDELDTAGVSWQVYTDDLAPLEFSVDWTMRRQWGSTADFFAALANGSLPSVVFIDATTVLHSPPTDEHPPADVQVGEAWTRGLVDAVTKSPLWSSTALLFTYDEAGGFADHVAPGTSCAPSSDSVNAQFTELGIRVPLIAISPYARPHFVSHAVHQHTSITRFIELVFGVPAMTARDANSDALLDMFDFTCPMLLTLPTDMPAAGTGDCVMP